MDKNHIFQAFQRIYRESPAFITRAPGRVNLIGEHTDYNDGFVLPMAINRAGWIALRPREDRQIKLHSLNLDETATIALDDLQKENTGWQEYIKGVAWALQEENLPLRGWEGVIATDVPIGAGLSSSAALELALARAFCAVSDWEWSGLQMAEISRKAENEWVGVQTGIMDQLISAEGQKGHALLIDCRSLEFEAVPLPAETAVVILDTGTRRGLVGSAYDERRAQCAEAADYFMVRSLRELSLTQFLEAEAHLEEPMRQRARHVITENIRTINAAHAMQKKDVALLGQLMNESHDSLRDDYEVSSSELNLMVNIAREQPECYGARMTGAGFGGCAIALVRADDADRFAQVVADAYDKKASFAPRTYVCTASAGAELIYP